MRTCCGSIELCVVGCCGQGSCGTRFWTNQRATRFSTLQPARPDQRPGRMETRVRYQQPTEAVPLWSASGNSLKGEKKSISLLSPLPAESSFNPRWKPRTLRRGSPLVSTSNHEKSCRRLCYFRHTPRGSPSSSSGRRTGLQSDKPSASQLAPPAESSYPSFPLTLSSPSRRLYQRC